MAAADRLGRRADRCRRPGGRRGDDDPLQLQAVGIGGWFREVHRLVDGLTLTENRRQLDAAERAALEVWRTGDHHQALEMLAVGGRVHAVETADDARSEMLMTWDELRRQPGPGHPRRG